MRLQRRAGKGPQRLDEGRETEATWKVEGSHVTPVQLQGVGSREFQSERISEGSSKESLIWWRSWTSSKGEREKMVGLRRRRRQSREAKGTSSILEILVGRVGGKEGESRLQWRRA